MVFLIEKDQENIADFGNQVNGLWLLQGFFTLAIMIELEHVSASTRVYKFKVIT